MAGEFKMLTGSFQERVEAFAGKTRDDQVSSGLNTHRMGKDQWSILRSLCERDWHDGCGWVWSNRSTGIKLLDSLVKRGLATVKESESGYSRRPRYTPNPQVRAIWQAMENERRERQRAHWAEQEARQTEERRVKQAWDQARADLMDIHAEEFTALVKKYLDQSTNPAHSD